tara:strand:- start:329 stop:655 length:327 start_codon:yes stop_codon:yes gene_type:complete
MDFEKLFKELKEEVTALVKEKFNKENDAIKNDIAIFFDQSKEKLKRWTTLLASGIITKEEYELLLQSQKDLVIMQTLYKAGISKIKLGHFKNKVIKLIVHKALLAIGL